jgi:hypothetical protein
MARGGKPFSVDTRPTKEVVVNSLTKDATVEACIFDLIDNSIDAARDTQFHHLTPAAHNNRLPDSYAGHEISLSLSGAGLKIEDTCGGIRIDDLKKMVMRFGERSSHMLGIGVFGVGLNRAIFKLGRITHLKTDTGTQRAELVLNVETYLKSRDWSLPAEEFPSSGQVGTEIEISRAPEEISHLFADTDWIDSFRHEVGRRYGRFIAKGLTIFINKIAVMNEEIPLRIDGPYEGEYKFYKTEDDVSIHVQYGQHRDHRFRKEADYDADRNRSITTQFGWTVLCNDRAILIADTSDKVGWDTKFHTEFYGFVGQASFIGDPAKLPWNTTKTDVDLNNHAYRMALKDMRRFAEKWRTIADQRKRAPAPKPIPPKPTIPSPIAARATQTKPLSTKRAAVKPTVKPDHNEYRTILPADVNEQHCVDKHLKVIHEAKELDLGDAAYTGLALLRMLFEFSASIHLQRINRFNDLKAFAIARRRSKGVKITPEDEKTLWPRIDEILPFLDNEPTIWGVNASQLKHIVKKMGAHQQTMNSALHNPFQQITTPKAFEIRNEIMPLLRHLIEK